MKYLYKYIVFLFLLFITLVVDAGTNYFIFNKNTGEIFNRSSSINIVYDSNFIAKEVGGDDWILIDINWEDIMLSYTTNDISSNISNTNEITGLIKMYPLTEEEWQNNKSSVLKQIENMYIDFLTNTWTLELRNYGIISNDYIITVTNTSELMNTFYLMTLRNMDTNYLKTTYNFMASEFNRFKTAIIQYGGIMHKVIKHNE